MKGILLLDSQDIIFNHNSKGLLNRIDKNNKISDSIKIILKKHNDIKSIDKSLSEFLDGNNLTPDDLYEALRYPINTKDKIVKNYINLHYREEKSLPYFNQIIKDIDELSREVVKFYSQNEV